jgi:two-component system copper resistance phosphate regulon response regulator CusR
MRILLVEDEPKVAAFIKKGLDEQAYEVSQAYDGFFGLKLALENDYDLIILDVIRPQKNGLEVCKEIHSYAHRPGQYRRQNPGPGFRRR